MRKMASRKNQTFDVFVGNLPAESNEGKLPERNSIKRESSKDDPGPPAKRKFTKHLYQSSFDWYICDEEGLWHCKPCRNAKFETAYAKGHQVPAKTTNHGRHASSQSHLEALEMFKSQARKDAEKMLAKKPSKEDELVVNLLKTAYHIAKRELPRSVMKHMAEYATLLGTTLNKAGTNTSTKTYTSKQSASQLQQAISEVILEDRLEEIKESCVFSLTIDESLEYGHFKHIILYARSASKQGLKYSLLSNKVIPVSEETACAANIASLIVSELEAKGLDITKLVGVCTNGSSLMTDENSGVVKLLQEYSPTLIGVHCAAQRITLAVSQAAKFVLQMEEYSRTVMNIFRYFKNNSTLSSNKIEIIRDLLNLPHVKNAEVHSVHWLSLEQAIQVIYCTYPALLMTLEQQASFEPAAKGLFQDLVQFKFIAITHLMMDILPIITHLAKKFQEEEVDFSSVKPHIASTCDSLRDLLEVDNDCVFVDKLYEYVCVDDDDDDKVVYQRPLSESDCRQLKDQIQQNSCFTESDIESSDEEEENESHFSYHPELRFFSQQKNILEECVPDYINRLVSNIEGRFCDTSVLECMKVLMPANISAADNVSRYGTDEVGKLVEHFDCHLSEAESVRSEYQNYKRLVKGSYGNHSLQDVFCVLSKGNDFPNLLVLIKCCLVIPVSSDQWGRGFSTLNRIKSKSRTFLKCRRLDDIMRISEDGPSPEEFDFSRAWEMLKKNVGKLFVPFGEIGGILVKESNKGKGPNNKYAFVKFLCEPDAERAIKEMDKKKLQGSDICISVKKADDKPEARKKFQNESMGKKGQKSSDTESNDGSTVGGGGFQGGGTGQDGESEMAMVTFVESPITVWVQIVNDENTKRIFNITEQLASLCPAGKHLMGLPEPGKVYGCLFTEDNMWYRCQVKQSLGTDRYKIQYIDYGNTEEVSVVSLVEIPPSLGNIKALANKVVLHNTRAKDLSDKKGIQYLKSLTDNQMTQLIKTRSLADGSGCYGIVLVNGQSVGEAVIQAGYGQNRPAFGKTGQPNRLGLNEAGDALGPQMMGTALFGNNVGSMPNFSQPPPPLGQPQPMAFNNQGGVKESSQEKELQKELTKKKRELEKTKNDKDSANMQLEYMRSKLKTLQDEYAASAAKLQEDTLSKRFTTLTGLTAMVRRLREQFPTNQKQTCLLEEAIGLCTAADRVENSSCSVLVEVGSALAHYKAAQDEISKCKDQTEISELVGPRDDARRELHTKLSMCLGELDKLPLESRSKQVDEFSTKLTVTYSDYLKFKITECPSLENLIPGFRTWKAKKDSEFSDVRMATDFCEDALQTALTHVKQRISVDTSEVSEKSEVDIDELMKTYAHALQREISVTDQSHSKDATLVATVVLSVMRELQQEASSLENFRLLQREFQTRKQVIEPWLDQKPEFKDMQENRKTLRSLKSKLRHTLADKIDVEESGSKDELEAIQQEVEKLRVELHATLDASDSLLGDVASLADSNFPELTVQYPDLGIDNYLLYKGLVKFNREIDHYSLSESIRPGVHVSQFNGKPVIVQEFHLGEMAHCSKEDFLKQIVQYNGETHAVQAVFFTKNERQGYVQSAWESSEPLEKCIACAKFSPSELQNVSRQLVQQVAAMNKRGFVHGEINPVSVFCSKDNVIYLMNPDFSKPLKERVAKRYVTDKGLVFQSAELQYSSPDSLGASVDVYNLALLLFMLHVPDGKLPGPRNPSARLIDHSLQQLFEGFMSGQNTSRVTAESLLQLDYFNRTIHDTPSPPVLLQPVPVSSPPPPSLESISQVPVIKSTDEPMEIGVFRAEDYIVTPAANFDTDDSWTTKSSSSVSSGSRVDSPLESAQDTKSETSNAESLQTVIEADCNSGDTAVFSGNNSEFGEVAAGDSETAGVRLATEATVAVKQIKIETNNEEEETVNIKVEALETSAADQVGGEMEYQVGGEVAVDQVGGEIATDTSTSVSDSSNAAKQDKLC